VIDIAVGQDVIFNIGLMIFDKDGTLIELYHYWSQMVALRAELICRRLGLNDEYREGLMYQMGVDLKKKILRPDGPVGLKKREVVMRAAIDYLHGRGHDNIYNLCFDVFREVDQLTSLDLQKYIKPIDGTVTLINDAHMKGCKIAIATTDKSERAKLAFRFLGLEEKIDIFLGADHVKESKPDPEMIFKILKDLNIQPDNAVMVGDALIDVQTGINAGLKASIGVLTGFATASELLPFTPYIAESVINIQCKTK
jgi:HAD superfamily hydrolase (TIGR01549 family)